MEVNSAIQNGEVPPKSKSTDLVSRVAVKYTHKPYFPVAYWAAYKQPSWTNYWWVLKKVNTSIPKKEMFSEFIKTIIERVKQWPMLQPTAMDIKVSVKVNLIVSLKFFVFANLESVGCEVHFPTKILKINFKTTKISFLICFPP